MSRILIFYVIIAFASCEENLNPTGFAKLTEIINKTESGLCAYGDGYLPFKVFNSYVGWQCYEETYKYVKKYSLYACIEEIDVIYQMPCLKIGSKIISFNLSSPEIVDLISKTVESDELRNQMVQCYLSVMAHCESQQFAGVPRPNAGFGTWVWVPNSNTTVCDVQTRNKFHIALLSISLIIGFPAVIVLFYYCWTTNQIALPYHRDLLTALVFRTLFTLVIQSDVFLDMMNVSSVLLTNGSTCKFLASMETIFGNLVWSFFVSEAIYLHKYAKNDFSKEPNIRIYNYILTGISIAFAVIWIIVMAAAHDSRCWLGDRTWIQWINDPLRIIFIIVHLVLIGDVIRMLLTKLKAVHDDTARILRRISLYTFLLIPLFLLQFALNAGQPEGTSCQDAYFYTLYFVDGIQCAAVSLFFFYFDKQIKSLVKATLGLGKSAENEHSNFRKGNMERSITTIDATQPVKTERNKESAETRPDVNYSSVVHPEQLEKIIQLYNRMNLTQKPSVTINDGEEFISCDPEQVGNRKISMISEYYDVESLNDFHDAITYQSSLSIFHDVNEFFDPNDKILSDENFQKKLNGNIQQNENKNAIIPVIEKNEINARQNNILKNDIEIQKSGIVTERPVTPNTKPNSGYKSKYLVQDSDTSSSSESEDSVVEVCVRRKNRYEGRLSLHSDVSSRPKSESDLSVAIPIPEELEPPSDGEKTPEVVLGGLAYFDENKTESVENWIKNNEELYAKYLEKKGLAVPMIIVSTEVSDLYAELNRRNDDAALSVSSEITESQQKIIIEKQDADTDAELSDSSGLTKAQGKSVIEKQDYDDESLSDQESGTESSKIKIKDIRRDSDVYHLLSGSESDTEENKFDNEETLRETVRLNYDLDRNKSQKEKKIDVEEDPNIIKDEDDKNVYYNSEGTSEEILECKTDLPIELNKKLKADKTELSYPISESNSDEVSLLTEATKFITEESLSESSEEDMPSRLKCESDSEFEIEKLKQMIPARKSSTSSSDSSSGDSSNQSTKQTEFEEPELEQSDSEGASSGINDYCNNEALKMYSPSELKRLNESGEPQVPMAKVFDNAKLSETNPELSETPLNDNFDPLPPDILEVDTKNENLFNFIGDERILENFQDDSYTLREKPAFFYQNDPDIYDDLKNYPNRKSSDKFYGKRQNYSDMFSKYKSKLLTEKNKSKSLEDMINEDASAQIRLSSSSSADTVMNQEPSSAEEVHSRLEKSKGCTNLSQELENESAKAPVFRNSKSDSSENEDEIDCSSSGDSIRKSKPKPTKRSFVPRQVSSNKDDDWEPQKVFY